LWWELWKTKQKILVKFPVIKSLDPDPDPYWPFRLDPDPDPDPYWLNCRTRIHWKKHAIFLNCENEFYLIFCRISQFTLQLIKKNKDLFVWPVKLDKKKITNLHLRSRYLNPWSGGVRSAGAGGVSSACAGGRRCGGGGTQARPVRGQAVRPLNDDGAAAVHLPIISINTWFVL